VASGGQPALGLTPALAIQNANLGVPHFVSPQDLQSALYVLDLLAVVVFAVTGALVASRKQMDIFGFSLLGTVTGVGGGTIRDVVLGQVPVFWVKDPLYIVLCVAASIVVFFTAHLTVSRYRVLVWLDCFGLSLVSVLGARRGLDAGPMIATVMGVITATFGGIIRDILGAESPLVLRKEVYVTAALIGAAVYVGLATLGAASLVAGIAGFGACFAVRALAIVLRWSLPAYRSRPGRAPEELDRLGL
jgi:uncharacterized membrane protein YeiH